jgi:uncharacterized membrane protein YgcG
MFKIAAIIGGMLLMAGVAFAGTRTMLEQASTPTLNSTVPVSAATTTSRQDDRGRENEVRGRANEPGEDLRGPCDEAEHANDPRCTGVAVTPRADDDVADDRGDDNPGTGHNRGPGSSSGPSDSSGHESGDSSGHGGGGGHSGHGGGGGDD